MTLTAPEVAEVQRTRIGADHGLALELGGLSP
jgi:hypothetical protein